MTVNRPAITTINSLRQTSEFRTGACPKAKGSVHMNPCIFLLCQRRNFRKRVKSAGIDMPVLRDYQYWSRQGLQRLFECRYHHPSISVGFNLNDPVGPETQQT